MQDLASGRMGVRQMQVAGGNVAGRGSDSVCDVASGGSQGMVGGRRAHCGLGCV